MVGRGIDVVRNKIKMFAQKKVTLPPGRHKVVILDEADRFVLLKVGVFILFTVKLFSDSLCWFVRSA